MNATQGIVNWNKERSFTTCHTENLVDMLEEELGELKEALMSNDSHEIIDALNDLRVIATGALWQIGQDPELSLKQTVKEISSRKISPMLKDDFESGKIKKWPKDPDQDPSTLYTADYKLSKRHMD